MKTMVVALFVLALTPLITEAEETSDDANKGADFCSASCADKKDPAINSNCQESCALSQRANSVFLESMSCLDKCTQDDNAPDCEEGCKEEYIAKAAEVTASCDAVCSKVEKDLDLIEECKKSCTPRSS